MKQATPAPNILDRFEVVVDPTAEPADWDEAVVEFLLRLVERKHSTTAVAPAAGQTDVTEFF